MLGVAGSKIAAPGIARIYNRNIIAGVASNRLLRAFGRRFHPLESENPDLSLVFGAMFREIKGLRYNERPQAPRPPVYLVT
jgi:hypothetical protein